MASSCSEQRYALLECLADSPCILAGRPIKECMDRTSAEEGCKELRTALFMCKRGQVRTRRRSVSRGEARARVWTVSAHASERASAPCAPCVPSQLDMRKRIKGNMVGSDETADTPGGGTTAPER